ncbi:MAG TPA: S-layer homology domain-containing protein [Thermomicrobiales bacterium]
MRPKRAWWRGVAATALVVGMFSSAAPQAAFAGTLPSGPCTVTSAADSGSGSLRALLADFTCGSIDFDLAAMGGNTITLTSGELAIDRNLPITGPGSALLTISGNNASRVFNLAASTDVEISGITISGGNANQGHGGGILTQGNLRLTGVTVIGNGNAYVGGGVANNGTGDLIVANSLVAMNNASNGGGLGNFGTGNLFVIQSAIIGNSALPNNNIRGVSAMDFSGVGGGIFNEQNTDTTVINSTISGNSAQQGGGIFNNEYTGTFAVEVYLSTIANNTATIGGGGIGTDDTADNTLMILQGDIIAGNTASDNANIDGVIASQGYNVVQTGAVGFTATGDQVVADAKIAPLASNAPNPLPTHHLLPGSPALNTLPGDLCTAALQGGGLGLQVADQRGVARPQGADCDSGALEVVASTPSLSFLMPNTVPAGSGETPLLINGGGFIPYGFTTVTFGGVAYPATFLSDTQLTITVPASALATAGSIPVIVTNAAPGSGSASLPFTVTPVTVPPPAATGYTLTVTADGTGTTGVAPAPDLDATRYSAGTVVTLTPQNSATSHLVGWRVDGVFQGWSATLDLTMNGNHTVQAIFRAPETFSDVPSGSFGSNAIAELTTRGIIKGYEDGTFGAGKFVLRAQIAALIGRAMGSDPASGPGVGPATWATEDHGNTFSDRNGVDDELWRAVGSLAFHSVAQGYGDGSYDPTDTVSHAQAISLITRAMVAKGYWTQQSDNPTLYGAIPAGSGHRADVATFVHYAGALPLTIPTDRYDGPNGWDQAATRAWVAEALWAALSNYHPVDRVP